MTAQPSMGWQTAWISSAAVHVLYFAFLCVACWLFLPSQQAAQHCELQGLEGMPLRQRGAPIDSCFSYLATCCHSQHPGWLASAVDSMQRLCRGLLQACVQGKGTVRRVRRARKAQHQSALSRVSLLLSWTSMHTVSSRCCHICRPVCNLYVVHIHPHSPQAFVALPSSHGKGLCACTGASSKAAGICNKAGTQQAAPASPNEAAQEHTQSTASDQCSSPMLNGVSVVLGEKYCN